MARSLSRPVARGTFPDQGSNSCPVHWQSGSYPPYHQGSTLWTWFFTRFLTIVNRMPILLMDNSQAHLWLTCPRENLFQLFCVCERDLHNYENYAYVVISWVFSLTYYQLSPYYGKWQFSNLTCLSQNIFSLFSSVQLLSCVRLFVTPWITASQFIHFWKYFL